ncbi:FAD dependent oxidoreductase [Aspergillus ambiguus]|uniref:NAD(P)/FAD-dependent oxidoreductase n=1 Tax=Aspergillus ambiguus TaxID=176160 RepID=UPI003CCD4343
MQEFLIVGGGIFGVSTAYHLALRVSDPSRITLLDRFPAPSVLAASTDINKIIRADYSNPLYMTLGLEAIDAWKNLPFFKEAGVYHQTGWVSMNEKHNDTPHRIRKNYHDNNMNNAITEMTEQDVRIGWNGFLRHADCRPFSSYYFNPLAGWANAGDALAVLTQEAIKLGVNYQIGEASHILLGDDGVNGLETRDGRVFHADKVLLATGAWTSQLMSSLEDEMSLDEDDRVERQISAAGVCVAHFNLSEPEGKAYSDLPVIVYGGQGEIIPPTKAGILKFTFSTSFKNTIRTPYGHAISAPADDQSASPPKLQEDAISKIKHRLPQILENDRKPDYYRICWDSISPSQHPLITRHPDDRVPNLYLAVGGSFHCYKFLPTIGKYVTNVLLGISNGNEKDQAWGWKDVHETRGVHESLRPTKEWRDFI